MSLRTLEAAILQELRLVERKPKIRNRDIMEWSTTTIAKKEGEVMVFLPVMEIFVCYKMTPK